MASIHRGKHSTRDAIPLPSAVKQVHKAGEIAVSPRHSNMMMYDLYACMREERKEVIWASGMPAFYTVLISHTLSLFYRFSFHMYCSFLLSTAAAAVAM